MVIIDSEILFNNYVVSRFDMYFKEWAPIAGFDDLLEADNYMEHAYFVGNSKVTRGRALRIVDTSNGTVVTSLVPSEAVLSYIQETAGAHTV